jgi:hypothetical protein
MPASLDTADAYRACTLTSCRDPGNPQHHRLAMPGSRNRRVGYFCEWITITCPSPGWPPHFTGVSSVNWNITSSNGQTPGSEQIYALMVNATASVGNSRPHGRRHAIIVLVREETDPEAQHAALAALEQNLWEQPEVRQIAPVNPKLGLSDTLESAIADAPVHGIALVVYDTPLPNH